MTRAPVLLISHGAATLSVQGPTDQALRDGAAWLTSSRAVLMISAHDVRPRVTVGGAERVEMWADHPAARGLSWEAPGDLRLAEDVLRALGAAGVDAQAGAPRLDHGAWVPLRALDPDGRRPVVTVSMDAHLDPARHLALGRALAPLRDAGVAIVTSGGLTHNQEAFRQGWFAGAPVDAAQAPSARFADHALHALAVTGPERDRLLLAAQAHPDFAWAHPTLDHWLPALIAAGAADGDAGRAWYQGVQHSLSTAMVVFGSA